MARWKDEDSSTWETGGASKSLSDDNVSFGKGAKGVAVSRARQACPGCVQGCARLTATLGWPSQPAALKALVLSDPVTPLLGTGPEDVIQDSRRDRSTRRPRRPCPPGGRVAGPASATRGLSLPWGSAQRCKPGCLKNGWKAPGRVEMKHLWKSQDGKLHVKSDPMPLGGKESLVSAFAWRKSWIDIYPNRRGIAGPVFFLGVYPIRVQT